MGYFYWLRVKSLNHLQTELNLGCLKGTKFCLDSKASFIGISSIASFKPFLIARLRQYFTFSDSSVINLKSSRWPKYTQLGTIFQKKMMFYYQNMRVWMKFEMRDVRFVYTIMSIYPEG